MDSPLTERKQGTGFVITHPDHLLKLGRVWSVLWVEGRNYASAGPLTVGGPTQVRDAECLPHTEICLHSGPLCLLKLPCSLQKTSCGCWGGQGRVLCCHRSLICSQDSTQYSWGAFATEIAQLFVR